MRRESQIAGGARDEIRGAKYDSYFGLGFGQIKRWMIGNSDKIKMIRAALRIEYWRRQAPQSLSLSGFFSV